MIFLPFLSLVSSAGFHVRVYYNDTRCQSYYTIGIQEYQPQLDCPPSTSLREICETKSRNPLALSSEGTGCPPVKGSKDIPTFLPPKGQGDLIPNVNYIIANSYVYAGGSLCDFKNGSVAVSQKVFAADGRCYAMEPNQYFKSSCSSTVASIWNCSDPSCNDCTLTETNLNTCFERVSDGTSNRYSCLNSNVIVNNPSTTTTAPPSSNPSSTPPPSNSASGFGYSLELLFICLIALFI